MKAAISSKRFQRAESESVLLIGGDLFFLVGDVYGISLVRGTCFPA